jgi:hypothetical protein
MSDFDTQMRINPIFTTIIRVSIGIIESEIRIVVMPDEAVKQLEFDISRIRAWKVESTQNTRETGSTTRPEVVRDEKVFTQEIV